MRVAELSPGRNQAQLKSRRCRPGSRPGDAGKATAQPSQSGKSYAVSESGVWAMRAARSCASFSLPPGSSSAGGRRAQHAPAPPGGGLAGRLRPRREATGLERLDHPE